MKITHCNNKDEAQALANFLWNEGERHMEDIGVISEDLELLREKWGVLPTYVKAFVKP